MKKGFTKIGILGTVVMIAIIGIAITAKIFATTNHENGQIEICHYTQSHWVLNTPNKSGNVGGHSNHGNDIIPPFDYWVNLGSNQHPNWILLHYTGKNWNTEGQAIWNNNCLEPKPTATPTLEPTATPTDEPTPTEIPEETITPTPTESSCPANSHLNNDEVCICDEGFHQQSNEGELELKIQVGLVCEPDETITPTESITPVVTEQPKEEKKDEPLRNDSTTPPRCQNGNTVNVPANPHVYRNGESATVNFFITEGDSANIYWSQVGQPHWQYAFANVKANDDKFVSFVIHDLDPKVGYDFGVQQKYGCGGGETITAVIVDGPEPVLFHFSYWEWNK